MHVCLISSYASGFSFKEFSVSCTGHLMSLQYSRVLYSVYPSGGIVHQATAWGGTYKNAHVTAGFSIMLPFWRHGETVFSRRGKRCDTRCKRH